MEMCERCVKVTHSLVKRMGYTLFPYQEEIIEKSHSNSAIVLSGRQIGKTFIMSIKALAYALVHPNSTILIVSPSLRQSLHIMRYVNDHISKLKLKKYTSLLNKVEVEFINKSRIISLPCNPHTIRGYTCNVIIVDEANFIEEELIEEVLFPTLATTKGLMWMISTPNIKDHIFYKLYCNPPSGWVKFTIPSSMNPLIPKEFLEEQRNILGAFYEREYECKYIEEMGLIPPYFIERCISYSHNHIHNHMNMDEPIILIDVGGKSSYMGVIICTIQNGVLYVHESRELSGEYLSNIDALIDEFKNKNGEFIIDASGVGGGILEYMERRGVKTRGVIWNKEREYNAFINMMRSMHDGMLNIDARCENLIKQLRSIIMENGKITTYDRVDDLLYALLLYYDVEKHYKEFILMV